MTITKKDAEVLSELLSDYERHLIDHVDWIPYDDEELEEVKNNWDNLDDETQDRLHYLRLSVLAGEYRIKLDELAKSKGK